MWKRVRKRLYCRNECQKALEELGLKAEVDHTDLSTSKNEQADLYIGANLILLTS